MSPEIMPGESFESKVGVVGEIFEKYRNAASIVEERLKIQHMGVTIKSIPFGGDEWARDILDIFDMTRLGFESAQRVDGLAEVDLGKFIKETSLPNESDLSDFLAELGFSGIDKKPLSNALQEYYAFWIFDLTGRALIEQGRVTPHEGFVDDTSFWIRNWNSEEAWGLIGKLNDSMEAVLYSSRPVDREKALLAGHFFATGGGLAS